MSELLKDRYSREYVTRLAGELQRAWPRFDQPGFVEMVLGPGWNDLELKQRMRRISSSLHPCLPHPYPKQIGILKKAAPLFGGFEAMLFPDFVEQFGLDDFETSMDALEFFTCYSSSEFAIRPFLIHKTSPTLAVMRRWTADDSEHVRRLASEGCRPRLPWGVALPAFKKDPSPILPILSSLKQDPSLYVRRSVANNLNDISKDHPQLLLEIARDWIGKNPDTDALLKHALRTLLKKGDQRALALFGFEEDLPVEVRSLSLSSNRIRIGENLGFTFAMIHRAKRPLNLRIEYAIDFVKASGKTSRKVFKITEALLQPGLERRFERRHRFCDFTTRIHHPGTHRLTLLINGKPGAETTLDLVR